MAVGAWTIYNIWIREKKHMRPVLNETTKKFITQMLDQKSSPSLIETSVEDFREFQAGLNANFGGEAASNVVRTDYELKLEDGHNRVRIHKPIDYKPNMPTLIYVAGGAFVTSGLDNIAPTRIANNCQVIVVGHRLAPEYKIHECVDDIASSVEYITKNANEFDIDGPIMVGGDSSGASFVLSAMIKLRDAQSAALKMIKGMAFISPAVDLSMDQTSMKEYDDSDAVFSLDAVKAIQHWLKAENFKDPVVSPIYASSLSGLPRCRIVVAECDRLRSHADGLYKKLAHDGVEVTSPHVCGGQVHAFLNLRGILAEGEDPAMVLNQMVIEELAASPTQSKRANV